MVVQAPNPAPVWWANPQFHGYSRFGSAWIDATNTAGSCVSWGSGGGPEGVRRGCRQHRQCQLGPSQGVVDSRPAMPSTLGSKTVELLSKAVLGVGSGA
eukprot:1190992-Prorocentrum_minimum.AAC.2